MPPAPKFKKMRGGGDLYMSGIDINRISNFSVSDIPGAVLWIKAAESMCTFNTIADYTKNLSLTVANNIRTQCADSLDTKVMVAINSPLPVSQPNSLVRLEVDLVSRTRFPKFISSPEELDAISIQDLIDPANPKQRKEKLSTKYTLKIPADSKVSIFHISKNIDIVYRKEIDYLFVSVLDLTKPATEFSEMFVYSRELTDDELEHVEGYLAYKKNDQYLLKFDHKYLPSIQSFPVLNDVSKQIVETEQSFINNLKSFDAAVEAYKSKLPDADILLKAPALKEKAAAAQQQLSMIRQTFIKGALLSRKRKLDSLDSVFDSINTLKIYSDPFTKGVFDQKFADFQNVMSELNTYMASLGNVDTDLAADNVKKEQVNQVQRRSSAQSLDALENTQTATKSKQLYMNLRKKMDAINLVGSVRYDGMYSSFNSRMNSEKKDHFDYYNNITSSSWNSLFADYTKLKKQFTTDPGNWLTYDPSVDTTNKAMMRGDAVYHVEYVSPYLNRIQTLFEQIRNQMEEGDIVFLKNEIDYHTATIGKIYESVNNKLVTPLSKTMFSSYCKKRLEQVIMYDENFKKLYAVLNDAITTLLDTLRKNKEYGTKSQIEKDFPIPVIFIYADSTKDVYIRELNKHDYSLTMIEYVMTNADGTVAFMDDGDCDFVFPKMENIVLDDSGKFYTRASTFFDDNGKPLVKKYIVLTPYNKTEGILDTIPKGQTIPKYFHKVDALFEIPRDAENSIYEMSIDIPQMPILLPKYAVSDGAYFICVNVGTIPFHIQIPGVPDDIIDLLGPNEICMYIYTGLKDSPDTYYGRVPWIKNRVAYDTLFDKPRTSLCSQITELTKMVYMQTPTMPLFDLNGYLVEANVDNSGNTYDIDDVYHSNPYKVTIGSEIHLSDLEVHPEWDEKLIPSPVQTNLYVVREASTDLPILCNYSGIPALNEFGYTKYLRTPALQIQDTIKTRSALSEPIEIRFNPTAEVAQYGLLSDTDLFKKVYRSKFVKLFPQDGVNTFIFVNSSGYPLVSPSNNYIQVENYTFTPPLSVQYTENLVKETVHIPDQSSLFIPSTTILVAKPHPMPYVKDKGALDNTLSDAESTRAIQNISYRYNTNTAYIQYTISKLQEEVGVCESMESNFNDIDDTIALLKQCIKELQSYQTDFASYNTNIVAIRTSNILSDKSMDVKMSMSTFDLKMKDTLEKVYKSFNKGMKAVKFFRNLLQRLDKIRAQIKRLRGVVSPENDKSILKIQTVIQNESLHSGAPADNELTNLLSTCTQKKLEFDGALKTLEDNVNAIPKDLEDISGWIDTQTVLIRNANNLRREIIEMETAHTVAIFTKKLSNNFSEAMNQLQINVKKVEALIKYKTTIAKWLGIYTADEESMRKYTEDVPHLFPNTEFKGYIITFPVFEEMSNPLVSRDWYTLADSKVLSDALRLRVSMGLIDPIKTLIQNLTTYYTNYDIRAYEPFNADDKKSDAEMNATIDASTKRTNAYISEAITNEANFGDIFEFYGKVSADLAVELQVILDAQATDIQNKWTVCTGIQTAIQTELQLLEPYLDNTARIQASKIAADMDTLFGAAPTANIEDVQRNSKLQDFYTNMNYLKKIELIYARGKILESIGKLSADLGPIQDSLESLESDVLVILRSNIEKSRANLLTTVSQMKANATSASELKKISDTIQPSVDSIVSKNPTDIPGSIELIKEIAAVPLST